MTDTPFTTLPSMITLNFEEKKELHAIEEKYKAILNNPDSEAKEKDLYQFVFSLKLKKTNNIGIHFFCLQHEVALKDLAANQNISTDIALLLFAKLEPNITSTMLASTIYIKLLLNPVLYNNLNIFEELINRTIANNQGLFAIIIGRMNTAPINILMILLPKISSSSLNETSSFSLFCTDLLNARSEEILCWVNANNPKLKGVPFSWVIRAYGFTNGGFDE